MANKIYVGDIGITFRVSTSLDLTTASVTKLKVGQPSGTAVEWTATVYGAATDGVLQYVSVDGDFPAAGFYKVQAYVELNSGEKFYGETVNFTVYAAYK